MHPLAAPGTLWVLSSDGKYLVRPQADETSHKEQISCARQGKGPILLFPYHKGFRLSGGDQRAFRSPFGNLRAPCCARDLPQEIDFLRKARERAYPTFSVSQRVSPQRRRPGGFPVAPWTPSGACIPCRWAKPATNSSLFVAGKENAFPAFSCMYKTVLKIQQKEPGAIDRTGLRLSKNLQEVSEGPQPL